MNPYGGWLTFEVWLRERSLALGGREVTAALSTLAVIYIQSGVVQLSSRWLGQEVWGTLSFCVCASLAAACCSCCCWWLAGNLYRLWKWTRLKSVQIRVTRVIYCHYVMHTFHYTTQDEHVGSTWLNPVFAPFNESYFLPTLTQRCVSTVWEIIHAEENGRKDVNFFFQSQTSSPWHRPVIIGASRVLEIYYSLYALAPWDFVPLMYK